MRAAKAFLGIVSVLFGLLVGPFFHIHVEEDDSHDQDHLATLHAHFFEEISGQSSQGPERGSEIEDEHAHHHGTEVTVTAASGRKVQTIIVGIQISKLIIEPLILPGHGIEVPVRAHDPPARRNTNPRSPPVLILSAASAS